MGSLREYLVRRTAKDGTSETFHIKARSGKEAYKKLGPWGKGWKKGYEAYPHKSSRLRRQ